MAYAVCRELRRLGHWADFTDPASGMPMLSNYQNQVYPDA